MDYDDKNIPHEAGLEHSHISYEKGLLCRAGNRRTGPGARARQQEAHRAAISRFHDTNFWNEAVYFGAYA